MVKGPKLPLPSSIHKNRPYTQVVMEQMAVVDQETESFLCEDTNGRRVIWAYKGQVAELWLL